jgi:hypothetical protein
VQIASLALFALLFAWNVIDDRGTARYFSAVMFAVFTAAAAWKILRLRDRATR